MVVVLLIQLVRKKAVKKLLLSYLVILVGYHLFVGTSCGPNSADVKVMKPQAEAITNYILKNGIPKSMADIPDLPYAWDRCERRSSNTEECYFKVGKNQYNTQLNFISDKYGADIYIDTDNKKSETGIFTKIVIQSNGTFEIKDRFKSYSTKNDGVCNPMRH
jgi:hypothetical protein